MRACEGLDLGRLGRPWVKVLWTLAAIEVLFS